VPADGVDAVFIGPSWMLGRGFSATVEGVGVAIESRRKRASALITSAVGTASMSNRPGRSPVFWAESR